METKTLLPGNSFVDSQNDGFCIEKIQNGDEGAFEELFKTYYLQLTRFAWRYVHSRAVAEEIVQEIFANLWEKRQEWDIDMKKSIRSYLYKAVKNLSLNHIKHREIKSKYDREWVDQKEKVKIHFRDRCREEKIRAAIESAIDDLPPRSKMTYKLHRHDGLTYEEIADVMCVSVKTVESQMTRTLKILRERLSYLLPFLIVAALAI